MKLTDAIGVLPGGPEDFRNRFVESGTHRIVDQGRFALGIGKRWGLGFFRRHTSGFVNLPIRMIVAEVSGEFTGQVASALRGAWLLGQVRSIFPGNTIRPQTSMGGSWGYSYNRLSEKTTTMNKVKGFALLAMGDSRLFRASISKESPPACILLVAPSVHSVRNEKNNGGHNTYGRSRVS